MSFTTKKYTRPLLRSELSKVNTNNFVSLKTLASAISPRTGTKSAKIAALRSFVKAFHSNVNAVFVDSAKGNKQYLLRLLKY